MPLAEAAYPMGIDGQHPALEMPEARRILPKATWRRRLSATVRAPRRSWTAVGGEERQTVGQLEDPLVQGATVPQPGAA